MLVSRRQPDRDPGAKGAMRERRNLTYGARHSKIIQPFKLIRMVEDGRMDVDKAALPKPEPRLEIRGLEPLKIIADPLRLRLVEALRMAPATVKELAAQQDVAPKSLYYHIGLLERHGMVKVVDSRLVSGILE